MQKLKPNFPIANSATPLGAILPKLSTPTTASAAENASTDEIDPIFSKINIQSLCKMFETDLKFSLTSIETKSNTNQQRLLNIGLFKKCWDKFGPYLPTAFYAKRLIEAGEELMEFETLHNVADTYCFSKFLDEFITNSPKESDKIDVEILKQLEYRAKFGRAMVIYQRVLIMDPCVASTKGMDEIEKILNQIIKLIAQCDKEPCLAGLLLCGTFHIRAICDHISKSSFGEKAIPFLKKCILFLENNVNLNTAEYLPWLTDLLITTYRVLIQYDLVSQGNNLIIGGLQKVSALKDFEMESRTKPYLKIIEQCRYELNIVLFGAEIRKLAGCRLKMNQKGIKFMHVLEHGELPLVTCLQKTSSTGKKWSPNDHLSNAKKQIKDLFPKIDNSSCLFITIVPELSKPYQANLKYNMTLDLLTKNMRPDSASQNLKPIIYDDHIHLDYMVGVNRYSEDIEAKIPTISKFAKAATSKKTKNSTNGRAFNSKREKVDDTEEFKKKQELLGFLERIQCFSSDQEKLEAILEGLEAMGLIQTSLLSFDIHPDYSKGEIYIRKLLDFGFHLLSSYPNSLNEQLPHVPEYSKVKEQGSLLFEHTMDRFKSSDVLKFSRYLFICQQHCRFNEINQLRISKTLKPLDNCEYTILECEMNLRASANNLYNVLQIERKVAFGNDEYAQSNSAEDLGMSNNLKSACNNLLFCINESIQKGNINTKIVVESALLMWKFVEPFLRDFNHTKCEISYLVSSSGNMVITILEATHIVLSQFPTDCAEIGIKISRKLALFYECTENYEKSFNILDKICKRISFLRQAMGESADVISSITANRELYMEMLNTPEFEIKYVSKKEMALKEMSCALVDILSALYRCHIKLKYQNLLEEIKKKEEQYFRLTQRKMIIKPETKESEIDLNMKLLCGDNLAYQAIYLMVFASTATHFSIEIRETSLARAFSKIKRAEEIEKNLLKSVINSSSHPEEDNLNIKILYKTHNSVAIVPVLNGKLSERANFCQAFCRKKSINDNIPITNTNFFGTGEPLICDSNVFNPIIITGLLQNQTFTILTSVYQTKNKKIQKLPESDTIQITTGNAIPTHLCWAYLATIACSLEKTNLAESTFKILWGHFVKSYYSENHFMNLPIKSNFQSLNQKSYVLNSELLHFCPSVISQSFLQVIFSILEHEYKVITSASFSNTFGSANYLKINLFRLKASQNLSIAMDIANLTHDVDLDLLSATKCLAYLSTYLRTEPSCDFTNECLSSIHSSLMRSMSAFENDRTQGILDYFIPTTCFLMEGLMANQNFLIANEIGISSLNFINKNFPVKDFKIFNSAYLEIAWGNLRQNQLKAPKTTIISPDFAYHESLAVSANWENGYVNDRNQLDDFCEYLDVLSSQCLIKSAENNIDVSNVSLDIYKKENIRRTFDSHITIKELNNILDNSRVPDVIYHELSRFRKNSRYINLSVWTIKWALEHKLHEAAFKMCMDLEDWISKRNLILSSIDLSPIEVESWEASRKKKRNSLIPAKKHHEKPEKPIKVPKNRGRASSPSKDTETKPNSRSSEEVNEQKKKADTKNQIRSRSVTPPNSKVKEEENGDDPNHQKANHLINRRKRFAAKQQYFQGMEHDEKEKTDKAIKVLDKIMANIWYKSRVKRRVRAIFLFEAPSRVELAYSYSDVILAYIKREILNKNFVRKSAFDLTLSELKDISFRLTTRYTPSRWNQNTEELAPQTLSITVQNMIRDLLHRNREGITWSTRYKLWDSLIKGIVQLVKIYKFLYSTGLIDSEVWKESIWLMFYIASDNLIDFFQTVTVIRRDSDDTAIDDVELEYMDEPDTSKTLPFSSIHEMHNHIYIARWKDANGRNHTSELNLAFLTEFFLISIEIISKSARIYRLYSIFGRLCVLYSNQIIYLTTHISALAGFRDSLDLSSNYLLPIARLQLAAFKPVSESALNKNSPSDKSANVLEIYEQVLQTSIDDSNWEPLFLANNEMGDFLLAEGDINGATSCWIEAIDCLFKTVKTIQSWNHLTGFNMKGHILTEIRKVSKKIVELCSCAKYAILAGIILVKIAKNFYRNNQDIRKELVLFAVSCMMTPIFITIPHPLDALDFINFQPKNYTKLIQSFTTQFSLDSNSLIESFQFCMRVAMDSSMPMLNFPIACLAYPLSSELVIRSFSGGLIKLLEIESLISMRKMELAIEMTIELRNGKFLIGMDKIIFADVRPEENEFSFKPYDVIDEAKRPIDFGNIFAALYDLIRMKLLVDYIGFSNIQNKFTDLDIDEVEQLKYRSIPSSLEKFIVEKLQKITDEISLCNEGSSDYISIITFLKNVQIEYLFQLSKLYYNQKKYGMSVKWLFTTLDRIRAFEISREISDSLPTSCMFTNIDILWLKVRTLISESLIALGYSSFARKNILVTQEEAEACKFQNISFYCNSLLIQNGDSKEQIVQNFISNIDLEMSENHYNETAYLTLETVADYIYESKKCNVTSSKLYKEALRLSAQNPIFVDAEIGLRLKLKMFICSNDISEKKIMIKEIFQIYEESVCSTPESLKFCLFLNQARFHYNQIFNEKGELNPKIINITRKILEFLVKECTESKGYVGSVLREVLLLLSNLDLKCNQPLQASKWLTMATRLARNYKIGRKLAYKIITEDLSKHTLYDIKVVKQLTSSADEIEKMLASIDISSTVKISLKINEILEDTQQSGEALGDHLRILNRELKTPYWPVSEIWQSACYNCANLIIENSYFRSYINEIVSNKKANSNAACIQWLASEPSADKWNLEKHSDLFDSIQVEKSSNFYYGALFSSLRTRKLSEIEAENLEPSLKITKSVPEKVLKLLSENAEFLLINIKRSLNDENIQNSLRSKWIKLLKIFLSFWECEVDFENLNNIPVMNQKTVSCLCGAFNINVGAGWGIEINQSITNENSQIITWALKCISPEEYPEIVPEAALETISEAEK